ncbi:MAG: Hsp70 nucleotide exchange factor (Fes1) [Lasallia pustulata]|uniref:Hsp70 nucleotide exchange factor (Fes1) n=1 Tax=Lasallia pustulata TaxID=136370 RepID=A0A1W5D1Q1_9LECA|nr:MAG: Hsp70 nucleotide exchange factor (Fes1) [Lasallia pustulata]SLM36892.1 Nucleotide exchange factor Fes1 [Lasallia pustulata]
MDPKLNDLFKWSIENTSSSDTASHLPDQPSTTDSPAASAPPHRPINPDALKALFGGPSDADLMKESMAAILSPEITLSNKLVAFDNFEQLIESLDNANNMEPLGLWTPLVDLLGNEEAELRKMAAWCVGTAVQNNVQSQERLLVLDGIPTLAKLSMEDPNESVRRKAIYALSSGIRNYQASADAAVKALPLGMRILDTLDAADMDAVDRIMENLREASRQKAEAEGCVRNVI